MTFGDVLGTAVGGVLNGAGAIIQGVQATTGKGREGTACLVGKGSGFVWLAWEASWLFAWLVDVGCWLVCLGATVPTVPTTSF